VTSSRARFLAAGTLTLVLFGANLWVFLERDQGFVFQPATLEELYEAGPERFAYVPAHYPAEDVAEARRILREEVKLLDEDDGRTRVRKLGGYLVRSLEDHRGTPTPALAALEPLAQYQTAIRGDGEFWCTNFADTYVFFATVAGVPTRKLSFEGPLGHTFAESYVDTRWLVVDLQARKTGVRDARDQPVGAVAVYGALRSGRGATLRAEVVHGTEIRAETLDGAAGDPERKLLTVDMPLVYQLPGADRRSLAHKAYRWGVRPDLVYAQEAPKARQRLKLGLLYGGLFAGFFLGVAGLRTLARRRRAA
jgi:hypothetical protein